MHDCNPSTDTDFFASLPQFSTFTDVTDPGWFRAAPGDWHVVIADVIDSTRAVREGRYKDVNMVGSCFITAVLNLGSDSEIPYVFGGDGAALLVPDATVPHVRAALAGVRALARTQFDLDCRLGMVRVSDLRTLGADVQVARFNLSDGNNLAMFSGGGVELAENLISTEHSQAQYAIPDEEAATEPDLSGLSCRWEPLRPRRGRMLCLLVKVLASTAELRRAEFAEVMADLSGVFDIDGDARPVSAHSMNFKWPPAGLVAEAKATRGKSSYLRRYLALLFESLLQAVMNRFDLTGGAYNAPAYREELQRNSDYRRFDDTLRMVLDCDEAQIEAARSMFARRYRAGRIAYGLHDSSEALMTCIVFSLERSEHLHFIDGGNGGFWAAASDYKQRLARRDEV